MEAVINALARHGRRERVALQFSGGRDSLACLYYLREFWDRLTVYHLDSGDQFPETRALIDRVKAEVPHFVEVAGQTKRVHEVFGIPSDIVPVSAARIGRDMGAHANPLIVDRYLCCNLSIMTPLHQRMEWDGVKLIIRGQRNSDKVKAPTRSGDVIGGFELLYPLESWDTARVMAFLRDNDIALPRFYEMMDGMPDCMSCSAWWEEGRAAYLSTHHPEAFERYQQRLSIIDASIGRHVAHFQNEYRQGGTT